MSDADLRAAIGWALVEENELPLGIEIVTESVQQWLVAGLIKEYRLYMAAAVDKAGRAGVERAPLEARRQLMYWTYPDLTDTVGLDFQFAR